MSLAGAVGVVPTLISLGYENLNFNKDRVFLQLRRTFVLALFHKNQHLKANCPSEGGVSRIDKVIYQQYLQGFENDMRILQRKLNILSKLFVDSPSQCTCLLFSRMGVNFRLIGL